MTITVAGITNYSGTTAEPMIHQFTQAGTFTVTGTYTPAAGPPQSRSIIVKSVAAAFPATPAVWVGNSRLWDGPNLPAEAALEADPRVQLDPQRMAASTSQFVLGIDAPEPRFAVARLGVGGPVLTNSAFEGFRFFSSWQTDVEVLSTFEDGSRLVAMGLVLSPVLSQVAVRVNIVVGGITFDDGTLIKTLTSADFNALGESQVRFILPASATTSVCHETRVYQGPVLLGVHTR